MLNKYDLRCWETGPREWKWILPACAHFCPHKYSKRISSGVIHNLSFSLSGDVLVDSTKLLPGTFPLPRTLCTLHHVWFVLPCHSFPSVSQSHKCCPEWFFLKWRSPAVAAHNPTAPQKKTGEAVIQLPPRRPKLNSLLQWGTVANILNLNLASSLSLPMEISTVVVVGARCAFFGITFND